MSCNLTHSMCLFSESSMERDRFMNPHEAKDFGLIDTVLEHPPALDEKEEDSK